MAPLDIIIPTCNRPRKLARALRSIQEQTLPPARVLVMDNGSNPGTPETVKQAEREARGRHAVEYHRSRPFSVYAALAAGIEAATTDWIIILDDDDFLRPHRLEEDTLMASTVPSDTVLIQHAFLRVDYVGRRVWWHDAHANKLNLGFALQLKGFGPCPSFTFRRSAALKGASFAEEDGWFDYNLIATLLANGKAQGHASLGYVMDDTRQAGRFTSKSGTKQARMALLHWSRHGHLAASIHPDPMKIKKALESEAAFYLGKGLGWAAFHGDLTGLAHSHPLAAIQGILAEIRSNHFSWLPFPLRGSQARTFAGLRASAPDLMQWIEARHIEE